MQPPPNEKDLIAQAKAGDKDALSSLYDYYVQAIYQYILYRVATYEIAEDLTADVFLRMVRGLARYNDRGAPFGAWLFRIAANRVNDHYRQRQETIDIPADYSAEHPDMLETIVASEETEMLLAAMRRLSADYQNILTLRFIQDMSYNEVAYILDKSEGAIRVMQHRALKALADALHAMSHEGDKDV
jgi:RNA polymerase sigma-70 factor (ECF subfamily)